MKFSLYSFLLLCGVADAGKPAERAVRDEFVRKMEGSIAGRKRKEALTSKLMEKASLSGGDQSPRKLEEYQDFGIDITDYALKYIGCQNVHQYSDELAAQNGGSSVLGLNRFVILRLCPRDSCSDYNQHGCNSQFGDFLIPMEDYLDTMATEYYAQYQAYCETCYYCMHNGQGNNNAAGNNGQNYNGDDGGNGDDAVNGDDGAYAYDDANGDDAVADDDANAAGDDGAANGDDGNRRELENDDYYYQNADFYNNMDDQNGDECGNYYNACQNYHEACQDYSQFAVNMEDFFQCGEWNVGNQVGYMGPHCRSDGKTIGLGLYTDENCNTYNSDMVDLSQVSGMDLGDENLKAYYSDHCISCLASDGYELEEQEDGVEPICGALYDMGAKCNRYMGNNGDINSYVQEDNEDAVCTFISNLITNSYDERGEIYLDNEGWQAYLHPNPTEWTKSQRLATAASALLVVGLMFYACYLHRVIRTSKYTWYPKGRRGYSTTHAGADPSALERMHSGIIQGRSRSGRSAELNEGGIFA